MKLMKNIFFKKTNATLFLLIAFALFIPFVTLADNTTPPPIVPATVDNSATNPVSAVLLGCTTSAKPCGWVDFINLINAMIKYGIELIGFAFVIALLYAGFLYLTSGGDSGKVKKVRDVLGKIMWGMIYTLCGWVIVYFILTSLGVDKTFYEIIK